MADSPFRSLKLYHYPATRSARAKWALHETVGDAFETVQLDLYAGAQYAPGYLAKNPNHNGSRRVARSRTRSCAPTASAPRSSATWA